MGVTQNVDRRTAVKWGILSAGFSLLANGVLSRTVAAQEQAPAGRDKGDLYEGANLPGGGQTDPRLSVSPYDPDPDVVEVAQRMSPFNPDSWHVEWARVADKNEQLGEEFEKEGCKITANGFYLRAARFRQNSVIYLPESDPRMLPAYRRLAEVYEKAWKVVPPPYERLQIPYEGNTLPAYFSKPRAGNPGQKFPTVISIGGADSVFVGDGSAYTSRGMAFIFVDGPGQGQPLRFKKVYAPPDSERVAKIIVDFVVARPDVDPSRIGVTGGSMGGYTAPRMAWGEKRIKACSMWSGAYSLVEDIFDYFPAIQDRLRWLCGAKDLADARKKMAEFTLEGRAGQIECPMFIGYSKDDRIMNPDGARKLYEAATRSERTVVEGTGHDSGRIIPQQRTKAPREILMADWMGKRLGAIA